MVIKLIRQKGDCAQAKHGRNENGDEKLCEGGPKGSVCYVENMLKVTWLEPYMFVPGTAAAGSRIDYCGSHKCQTNFFDVHREGNQRGSYDSDHHDFCALDKGAWQNV